MQPNYDNSILNLMMTLSRAFNHESDKVNSQLYPDLTQLDRSALQQSKQVILIVIDGLASHLIEHYSPDGFFKRNQVGELTSVFPSTTASAITTFNTALAPNTHAVVGWDLWLREIGQVASILPFKPTVGKTDYREMDIPIERCLKFQPFYAGLNRTAHCFHPDEICGSDFNNFATQGASNIGYGCFDRLMERIEQQLIISDQPSYSYLYWPYFDSICHESGVYSAEAEAHFKTLEATFEKLINLLLSHRDTHILLTADHGMIDTTPEQTIHLSDFPEIEACLSLPLTGEPRVAYCFVKEGYGNRFEKAVLTQLEQFCTLHHAKAFIEAGWFGRGEASSALKQRVGDYVLVMKEHFVLHDLSFKLRAFKMIGVHGGSTPEEMLVPLCQWRS